MFTNWVTAGGNLIAMRPDKKLASLLGLTDAGDDAGGRLPAGQYRRRARRRHRRPDDAVSRHGRPLHAQRRDRDRDAVLDRDDGDDQSGRDRAECRQRRRAGGGVHLRPRTIDRLHAAGQPGLVGPGARRPRRRSARTICSSAALKPTRSTSTRWRFRRPTSSSGCWPT